MDTLPHRHSQSIGNLSSQWTAEIILQAQLADTFLPLKVRFSFITAVLIYTKCLAATAIGGVGVPLLGWPGGPSSPDHEDCRFQRPRVQVTPDEAVHLLPKGVWFNASTMATLVIFDKMPLTQCVISFRPDLSSLQRRLICMAVNTDLTKLTHCDKSRSNLRPPGNSEIRLWYPRLTLSHASAREAAREQQLRKCYSVGSD